MANEHGIEQLIGKTLTDIVGLHRNSDRVQFTADDGKEYCMFHDQDCCESVSIEDVCGNEADLLGTPIVEASERTSETFFNPEDRNRDPDGAQLWTFYRISTITGTVVIRWYGRSNGYYGVSVSFGRVNG